MSYSASNEPSPYYDDSSPAPTKPTPVARPSNGAPSAPTRRRTRGGARIGSLAIALVAVVGLWVTWSYFVLTARGQEVDQSAFDGATYGQGTLWLLAEPVLDVVSVSFVVIGIVAVMTIAFLRRHWGLAAQAAVVIVGSNVTTQVLKHQILERPDLGVPAYHMHNSLPSGHTTVAASVSMALVLVVPRRLRPLVAVLGASYTAATGISTLIGQWHRPSDVIAAVLIVLVWTALVCALTPHSGVDRNGHVPTSTNAIASTVLVGGAILAGVVSYAILTGADVPGLAQTMAGAPDIRAYLGMSAGVVAATALVFVSGLLVRQATARG